MTRRGKRIYYGFKDWSRGDWIRLAASQDTWQAVMNRVSSAATHYEKRAGDRVQFMCVWDGVQVIVCRIR